MNDNSERSKHAETIIRNHVIWSMGAGLIPVLVADVFAVWSRHLDGRKAAIVAARLPDVLKPLWPAGSD